VMQPQVLTSTKDTQPSHSDVLSKPHIADVSCNELAPHCRADWQSVRPPTLGTDLISTLSRLNV
jgi:hypothetical protein